MKKVKHIPMKCHMHDAGRAEVKFMANFEKTRLETI